MFTDEEIVVMLKEIKEGLQGYKNINVMEPFIKSATKKLDDCIMVLDSDERLSWPRVKCPACLHGEMNKGCPICDWTGFIEPIIDES